MTTILFDVTRLLRRGGRRSPTGIDRVVLAYARWLVSRGDLTVAPVWTWGDRVIRISDRRFEALLRLPLSNCADGGEASFHPQWAQLMRSLSPAGANEPGLRPADKTSGVGGRIVARVGMGLRYFNSLGGMRLPPGAIYINVGHSGLDRPELLARLRAEGLRSIVLLHDLIPIIYPEFCGPGAAARHHRRLDASLMYADGILTNSATTAQDVRDYAAQHGLSSPSLFVAPLGLEPAFLGPAAEPINASRYFVCVGTIEPRKNLVMLLKIWRRLADLHGAATPRLVLVGRRGWENETVLDHLQRSPPVRQYVHEVSDLSDEELARLLRGSCALLAPSAAEGYDLPAVEALSMGVRVIASDIPVHRELAHGATLLDPIDGSAWLREIQAHAAGPRRSPSPPFQAPTWEEHFQMVEQAIAATAAAPSMAAGRPRAAG